MSAAPTRLRALHAGDASAVAAIAAASFSSPWEAGNFSSVLESDACLGLGAFAPDGRLQAYLVALEVSGEIDVVSVATDPSCRRRGLARALFEAVFLRPATARVVLEVAVDNAMGIALYESLGFIRMGVRRRYYGGVKDALTMNRNLRVNPFGDRLA